MFVDDDGPRELYAAEFLYRERGCYQNGRKQFRRCLPAFDKAVELTPTDYRAREGRSWARAKTTNYTCAIEDMDKALKAHPGDLRATQLKALYKFLRTDFESAMVINERGRHLRKKPNLFIIGSMQCEEVVERTIGKRGGHGLRDHYDIIRTIAWKNANDLRIGKQWKPRFKKRKRKIKHADNTPPLYTNFMKKTKHQLQNVSEISILDSLTDIHSNEIQIIKKKKSEYQPPQARTTNVENMMAEKYLGKMCYDKRCLKDLRSDPRIFSPNYEGSVKLKTISRKGFKDVRYRQEILRVREPFYSIKYNEVQATGALLQRQIAELEKVQTVARNDAETLIKLLRAAREAYLTNTAQEVANKAKTYIDKKSLKLLPNKEIYLRQLYELIGLVYLDTYRLKENVAPSEFDPIKRINFLFGLPISREPSQDSVIKANKSAFMNIKEVIVNLEKRLFNATTPLETVWEYYELAKLNLELKKYDLSRFYARKSLNMARVLQNNVWTTVVNMLITSSHVRQRNKNEAKNELLKTREFAKLLKAQDTIKYINKCIEVVESIDFDDICILKVITERQKAIGRSISDKRMLANIKVLFQRMDVIPSRRRMSIMPGVRFEEDHPGKKLASKASIVPRKAEEIEFQKQIAQKKGLELLDVD